MNAVAAAVPWLRLARISPILAAMLAPLPLAPGLAATPIATVLKVAGPVDVRLSGSWRDAAAGDRLDEGDAIRTGQRGYATLRDRHGTVTEVFPLASVEFPRDAAMKAVAGRIWAHFRKIPGLAREIRTPTAVALIRGTTLAVEATGGQTRVMVLEGLVEVRDPAGRSVFVPDGYAVRADRDGLGRVERALDADLVEGRQFLERSRSWFGPDGPVPGTSQMLPSSFMPSAGGVNKPGGLPAAGTKALPGGSPAAGGVNKPGGLPVAGSATLPPGDKSGSVLSGDPVTKPVPARRPSALERAEAAFEAARRHSAGKLGNAGMAGHAGLGTDEAAVAGPEAGAEVGQAGAPGLPAARTRSGRLQGHAEVVGVPEPANPFERGRRGDRAERAGSPGSPLEGRDIDHAPLVRGEVGPGTGASTGVDMSARLEARPLPDSRAEVGMGMSSGPEREPLPGAEPAVRAPEGDQGGKKAPEPSPERKDPILELDSHLRPGILGK